MGNFKSCTLIILVFTCGILQGQELVQKANDFPGHPIRGT